MTIDPQTTCAACKKEKTRYEVKGKDYRICWPCFDQVIA